MAVSTKKAGGCKTRLILAEARLHRPDAARNCRVVGTRYPNYCMGTTPPGFGGGGWAKRIQGLAKRFLRRTDSLQMSHVVAKSS
jgi:hypothetical protein